jgi:hypothetical protein
MITLYVKSTYDTVVTAFTTNNQNCTTTCTLNTEYTQPHLELCGKSIIA